MSHDNDTSDVVVVGAGIVGAAIAWRLATKNHRTTLVDPTPGQGATHAAAGMLAPVTELHYGEERLLHLNLASARRYPDFVAELAEDTPNDDVGFRTTGTVVAAWDGADLATLRDLQKLHKDFGLASEMLTARDLRALEPATAPGLPGGLYAADDHAVDPRRLHHALLTAFSRRGGTTVRQAVKKIDDNGVELTTGTRIDAGHIVVAAGATAAHIEGPHQTAAKSLRPVKGQTLRLRAHKPVISHVLRGSVRGNPVYLVPRDDGELVIGASSEDAGYDDRPRAGAVYDLLRDAQLILPAVTEIELVEISTGLRPCLPDNAPLIENVSEHTTVAIGHYRNGVLLAPVTADIVADLVARRA